MSPQFIANPPEQVKWSLIPKHLWLHVRRFGYLLLQPFLPFNARPDEIDPFPDPTLAVTEAHVQQCQWIFDQAEARRDHLEQKAQSTFGLMTFLVPLLASLFVFIISRATATGPGIRTLAIALLLLSAVFLILGFISAARAVAVKANETLFLHSVVDKDGQFQGYSTSLHARGLLYCASMNTGLNDHIAQFVKGAHVLTAAAVIVVLIAAVPAGFVFSALPSSPVQTEIVKPVTFSSPDLKNDLDKLSDNKAAEDKIKLLEAEVQKLEVKLSETQKKKPNGPNMK